MTLATFKQWQTHMWARFIPGPATQAYIGLPVTNGAAVSGYITRTTVNPKTKIATKHEIDLQLAQCDYRQGVPQQIIWTREWQAMCIDRGFFLHRSWPYNFVNILDIRMVLGHKHSKLEVFSRTMRLISLRRLAQQSFREPRVFDQLYDRVFAFIEQQDRYGCSNTWEDGCDLATSQLEWYRTMKARQRKTERDKRVVKRANQRIANVLKVGFKKGHQ